MSVRTIRNAYLLLEADTRQRLEWQFMPDQIGEDKPVNWNAQTPIGRSEPYISYESSGSRVFTFALKFAASVEQGDGGSVAEVIRKVNWLCSLRSPEVANGLVLGPPVCRLIVGQNWINTRVVASGVQPMYEGPWEANEKTGLVVGPMMATVSLSLIEVNLYPQPSSVIRAGLDNTMPNTSGGSTNKLSPGGSSLQVAF